VTYRLVGQAGGQVTRILTDSARKFGLPAAERYYRLMLAAFAALSDRPIQTASDDALLPPGVRVYPLSLARRLVPLEQRVGRPRHIVLYRVAPDGVVEVLGLAHDRMLLGRAARRMQREADV
jgi:toxin ParE1/3/4